MDGEFAQIASAKEMAATTEKLNIFRIAARDLLKAWKASMLVHLSIWRVRFPTLCLMNAVSHAVFDERGLAAVFDVLVVVAFVFGRVLSVVWRSKVHRA
eukprot:8073649-Lingulodinium_polyedra.AAC.1